MIVMGALLALGWFHAWQRVGNGLPVFALSADDFSRMLDARSVAAGTLLPTDVWPPLPAWLAGALVWVGVPFSAAPAVVNFACAALAAVVTADCAVRMGVGRLTAVTTAFGWLILPWTLRLGASGLAEMPAAAAISVAMLGVVFGRAGVVAVGILAATMCRYEAIAFVVPFWVWVVARGGRQTRDVVWLPVPCLFFVAWMAWSERVNGDALAFVGLVHSEAGARPPLARALARTAIDCGFAMGWVLPLGLVGLYLSVRRARGHWGDDPQFGWAAFVGLAAVVALAAQLAGLHGIHNAPRFWLVYGALVLPFAAIAVDQVAARFSVAVFLPVALSLAFLPVTIAAPPELRLDTYAAAAAIGSGGGASGGGDGGSDLDRRLSEAPLLVEVDGWEFRALMVLVGPDRVTLEADGDAMISRAPGWLAHGGVVVVTRDSTREVVAPGRQSQTFGAWTVVSGGPP